MGIFNIDALIGTFEKTPPEAAIGCHNYYPELDENEPKKPPEDAI